MDRVVEAPTVRQIQATNFYCGAACAAMLLSFLGRKVTQDAAYERIRAANIEPNSYYSDPEGLMVCLESVAARQATNAIDFEIELPSSAEALLGALLDSLSSEGLPLPVLVKGGAHWVLTDGIVLDREGETDTVKMVAIVDPWPTALDRTFIPGDIFRDEYIRPIRFGAKWRDKMVIVAKTNRQQSRQPRIVSQPEMGGGANVDDTSIATRLEDLGIGGIKAVLAGGLDIEPVEVKDLDGGPDYVISPLDGIENDTFKEFILVAHDAVTGKILEVARFDSRLTYFKDGEASALAASQLSRAFSLDEGYFFFSSRRLRSRFLVARRLRSDGVVFWLMPGGDLVDSRDQFEMGG